MKNAERLVKRIIPIILATPVLFKVCTAQAFVMNAVQRCSRLCVEEATGCCVMFALDL